MSDKMNNEPRPGWRRVKFGDVVRQSKTKADPKTSGLDRYIAGEHMDTDDLRLRRWGEIGSGYLGPAFHMRFEPGQVLYGSRRTYLRKVAVADFSGICANTTFVLESMKPAELLPGFLPLIMQADAFNEFSVKNSKGSVNPYINFSDLANYELDLPPPERQESILELTSSVSRMEETLRSARVAALETYERMTLEFFAPNKAKYHDPDPTAVYPADWRTISFQDACAADAPICYGIVQVQDNDPDGVPTVAIKDLNGTFGLELHRTASSIEAGYARSRIVGGDLLISVKAVIGEIALVPDGFTGNISRDLARIRLNPELFDRGFCLHLIRSRIFRRYLSKYIVGSTRDELSIGTLRTLRLPLPDIEEQKYIAGALEDALITARELDARIQHLAMLKKRMIGELL